MVSIVSSLEEITIVFFLLLQNYGACAFLRRSEDIMDTDTSRSLMPLGERCTVQYSGLDSGIRYEIRIYKSLGNLIRCWQLSN